MSLMRSFIILILISLTIYPQTQTTLKDLGTLSSKTSTAPGVFNGSATYKNYVYVVGLGKVYIYNEIDPKNPAYINTISIYSETGGARRVWVGENYLFVYTGYRIKIYDLANPESPLLKSDYFSGEDLHKVSAKGNYMFVLYMTDQKYGKAGSLEIVDISNPSSAQLKGTYKPSNYEGRSFFFSDTENRIFVAHYENLSKKGYIREIDYSDPINPLQVRELIVDGATIEISVNGNTLFMLKDGGWTGSSKLEAYNLASSSISLLSSLQVSTERAWDMHVYGNSITTTLLENNGIKDYTWNETGKSFEAGQLLNIPLASQASWYVVSTKTSNSITNLKKTTGGYWIYIYYYIVEKSSNSPESEVYGYTMRLIEKAVWIEEPDVNVTLITSVFPPEASADGCTVSPSGTNQYGKNSTVSLNATAGSGWVFANWTGSLSGSQNPQDLKMDNDKNVVGNFQPILTLSLTSPAKDYLCPPGPNEDLTITTANIFVDGVDWMLSGISFTVVEPFKPDYTEAWIEYSGTKLKGTISTDANGFATSISFSPSKQIDEGNTLAVKLFLKFNYPSRVTDKYIPDALTEVKKYKVSIHVGLINCLPIPDPAKPGVKGPPYPPNIFYSNTQTVASVWNASKSPRLPFASIQQAINDPATVDGNTIELCPCLYIENVNVPKSLTIKAITDYKSTIVEAKEKLDHIFYVQKKDVALIKLTIRGANGTGAAGVYVEKGSSQKMPVDISYSFITDNYYGVYSNSIVNITSSQVTKSKDDGIQCDTLKALSLSVDNNTGNGVYCYGDLYFESEVGVTASASYNGKNGLYSKSNIWETKGEGFFKFNGNGGSGVYCDGRNFEIRGKGLTADSNKNYGIYSRQSLKGANLFTRYNSKDGIYGGVVSCTNIFTDHNEGDGIKAEYISLTETEGKLLSASYNKGNGIYSNDWVVIAADKGFVKINKNGQNGIYTRAGTEILDASKCNIDSNMVYGIDSRMNLRIRNASISYNSKGGINGGYITSSNLIVEHNKGDGIKGSLIYLSVWDGYSYSVSYNDGNGISSSDWVVGDGDKSIFKFNKNGSNGIYARAGTEIYTENKSSIDSNTVLGIDSPQNLRIRNASISYNGKGGINGGYISSSNLIVEHNNGDGIKGDLIYVSAGDGNTFSSSYNQGNGIVSTDWTVGDTELGRLKFNRNGASGIFSPKQSVELFSRKATGGLSLDSNGAYGVYGYNNLKIKNASASYNGKDGLFGFYISSSNIKADFNKGNGFNSNGLIYVGSNSGFRSSANDNDENGVKASEAVLFQFNTLRNKKDGVTAWILEYNQGASNNNSGWGAQISGYPSNTKISTVNLTGNASGAINYTFTNTVHKVIYKTNTLVSPTIIENCDIVQNFGPGIVYAANDQVTLTNNNIAGNKDYGVQNTHPSGTIDASNNWWGSATGPSGAVGGQGDKVGGNVNVNTWMNKQVAMLLSLSKDTLATAVGITDTVLVFSKQLIGQIDRANITIIDPSGLIKGNHNLIVTFNGNEGFDYPLEIKPPLNSATGVYPITINVVSNTDPSINASIIFYVNIYASQLAKIKITPEKPIVAKGFKIQLNAKGEDQFGKTISINPGWSCTGGTIDTSGLYTAGDVNGEYEVGASSNGKELIVKIKVVSVEKELTRIIIYPDSAVTAPGKGIQFYSSGKDQYDSTFAFIKQWEVNGGTIDSTGLYIAGNQLGEFKVKLKNQAGNISGEAKVVIAAYTEVNNKILPTEYSITQNYPNPFNPVTVIRYSIPKTEFVSLKVYDILGREVDVLVNEEKSAGNYEIRFNASRLSSGVYFYQLRAGNFVQTKKFLLLK